MFEEGLRTQPAIIKALIDARADINFQDLRSNNKTFLHVCAQWGCLDNMKLLLENGADPFLQDVENCTPLDDAIELDQHEAADILEARMRELRPDLMQPRGSQAGKFGCSKGCS